MSLHKARQALTFCSCDSRMQDGKQHSLLDEYLWLPTSVMVCHVRERSCSSIACANSAMMKHGHWEAPECIASFIENYFSQIMCDAI